MKLKNDQALPLSVALGQQAPSTRFDAKKTALIAEAIAAFSPSRQAEIEVAMQIGEHAIVPFVSAVDSYVNTRPDGTPRSKHKVSVNVQDVLHGYHYWKASTNESAEVRAAAQSGDWAAVQALIEGPVVSSPTGLEWTERLHVAARNHVGVRVGSAEQLLTAHAQLEEVLVQIADAKGPERDALRRQAGDAFATLVVTMALTPWEIRADNLPSLEPLIDRLAQAGVPGCLGPKVKLDFAIDGLGLAVSTRLRADPPAVRWAALAWQLEHHGDDPNFYRPGQKSPAILIAQDEKFLGRPGAPLGILSKDQKHVFIPTEADVSIIEHRKTPYGIQQERLGFHEYPREGFHLETALRGVALKLPIELRLDGQSYRLEHGRYVGSDGALSPSFDGSQLTLGSKSGASVHIDLETGAIS